MWEKVDVSKSICDGMRKDFFEMKEECTVFCSKLVVWSKVAHKVNNILIFYIFKYSAGCSAESGAKQYFMTSTLLSIPTWIPRKKLNSTPRSALLKYF